MCTFFVGVGGYEEAWLSSLKSLPSYSGYTSSSSPDEQVWSLTQLYSVDSSKSWIGVKKCFYKHTNMVFVSWIVCIDGVLVNLHFRKQRTRCKFKKPCKGPRRTWGSCWEEQKRKVFPRQGVIDGQKIECLCLQLATTSSSGCHTTFLTSCVWAWSTEAHEYSSSSWSTSQIHTDLSLKTKKWGSISSVSGISDLCRMAIIDYVIIHNKSFELILTEDFLKK